MKRTNFKFHKLSQSGSKRTNWENVLEHAAGIVNKYETGVTLRQLFYQLVAAEILPNTTSMYQTLSRTSAEARREGWFPDLEDRTRRIHRPLHFSGVQDASDWLLSQYRRDRTEGQPYSIYLGVEKSGMVNQLMQWFDKFGIPVAPLGGYTSQSFIDEIAMDVYSQDRPAILLYAGDFDASGKDISRDLVKRLDQSVSKVSSGAWEQCFQQVENVALNPDQIRDYNLPPQMGKASDPRAAGFVEKYGRLIQVELDALPPEVLKKLYSDAITGWWGNKTYRHVLEWERADKKMLSDLLGT